MQKKTLEMLQSLTEAARAYWEGSETDSCMAAEDHFETELVRAEDYLEEVIGDADLRV
jgi:hypothetical protein